jgi:hypothetical protein
MIFLSSLQPSDDVVAVTYFDEAYNLDVLHWILMRLVHCQPQSARMWYVFMGTKSRVSYYAPSPVNSESLFYWYECSLPQNSAFNEAQGGD